MQYQTIIVGGGAAGLMAAITAARQGRGVLIIERNNAIGRKILVTGNGHCNLANTNLSPDKYYGRNTKCLHNIFSRFSCADTMAFFEGLGVRLKSDEAGRVLPATERAADVLDALTTEIARLKINTKLNERVSGLSRITGGWKVATDKNTYQAGCVVLAAGGKSYPQLGSTGDGFDMARQLGHRIIEPRPGLVPLELAGSWFRQLSGVSVNAEITLTVKGKSIACKTGELLFTHFGISGPLALDLSRLIIVRLLEPFGNTQGKPRELSADYTWQISRSSPAAAGCRSANTTHNCQSIEPGCEITVNFFPGSNSLELSRLLSGRWQSHPQKTLANSLYGLLPKNLGLVLVEESKVSPDTRVGQITKKETQLLAERLTCWPLEIARPRPFAESMVTAGGVPMDEVNTRTMESLKAKGIYLAGEVLDIDGVSGGYNLQFAWSTGYLAGLQL